MGGFRDGEVVDATVGHSSGGEDSGANDEMDVPVTTQ